MSIKTSRVHDEFQFFPYPPDHENGRTNNGGIDLIREPHRIDEISELHSLSSLRQILCELNSPDGKFITLGVEAGEQNGLFEGYIELAFRDSATAREEENYHQLLDAFSDWVRADFPREIADGVHASLVAELQHFHLHGASHGDRMTLWFRTANRDACDWLLKTLAHFLLYKYVSRCPGAGIW